jgi:lipoyl(octanoyl) transferase
MSASIAPSVDSSATLHWLGRAEYETTWRAMQRFTDERTATTRGQIWFLEHAPVFTLGMNGKPEHVLAPGNIPVINIDRGGQVTYHGPGQLVVYPLLDIRRAKLGVRELVIALENTVIKFCEERGVAAIGRRDAPGVYVEGRKLASIGLRVRRGCSYHGMAFNVAMDLEPYQRINPCGFSGLEVTDLKTLGVHDTLANVARELAPQLLNTIGLPHDAAWI